MAAPYWMLFLRAAVVVGAAIVGVFLGFHLGAASLGVVTDLIDRHLFDPKEMGLSLAFSGAALGAAAGIWLVLVLTRAGRGWQRGARILFGLATLGSIAMIASAFHWPISSGPPLVQYELRLPAGTPIPRLNEIQISIWHERTGHGVFIERIGRDGDRPEIAGDLTIISGNHSPTMSLQLRGVGGVAEGYWRLPYRPDSPLEGEFGPWQRIAFIPHPRPNAVPLPPGDYEIRYRVRRYLRQY